MMRVSFVLSSIVFVGLGVGLGVGLEPWAQSSLVAAEPQAVTIRFQGQVGQQPFRCGETYRLGQPATPVTASDFRFYVSDVALLDASGRAVPVTLQQDGKWQYQSVALLDFEDKTATCANGTPELRDRIVGTVPAGNYQGIRFRLGVPFALNHADATLAPSPLNLTSLWWNWRGGYKFLRVDLARAAAPGAGTRQLSHSSGGAASDEHSSPGHGQAQGFSIHLGSTACQASATTQAPATCANPNRAEVSLINFDPGRNVVVADLAALVAGSNLTVNQPNTPAGCMAAPEDGDCRGVMRTVGLPFGGQPAALQTFFRVE